MSIFKETFPKFIKEQIKVRESIIGSGINHETGKHDNNKRGSKFYTYSLNKQCLIRLSSGVNITNHKKFSELTADDKQCKLAKDYILEGGILDGDKVRGGIGTGGAYGDPKVRGDAKDGFGIVPMPGITDATIRTKSAYGSLREGKVKFVCHNKRQLEVLEILYMRPGYTVLLEWQWTPFFDNDREQDDKLYWIGDYFFDSNSTSINLEKHIHHRRSTTGGNYDALIGYVKNFSYKLRPDGGYECETEIIAKGEVIESLKDKEMAWYNKDLNLWKSKPKLGTIFLKILQYSHKFKDESEGFTWTGADWWKGSALTDSEQDLLSQDLKSMIDYDTQPANYSYYNKNVLFGSYFTNLTAEEEWSIQPHLVLRNQSFADFGATENTGDQSSEYETTRTKNHTYIRWDVLCHLINKYVIPKRNDGSHMFQLQTNYVHNYSNGKRKVRPLLYHQVTNKFLEKK